MDLAQDDHTCLPSLDDNDALSVMRSSCTFKDGHYCMRLPWKKGCPSLPNNYNMTLSRLTSLGRWLRRDQDALVKYRNKISKMIQLGHAVRFRHEIRKTAKEGLGTSHSTVLEETLK